MFKFFFVRSMFINEAQQHCSSAVVAVLANCSTTLLLCFVESDYPICADLLMFKVIKASLVETQH